MGVNFATVGCAAKERPLTDYDHDLRLDRRLIRRRGWIADEDLERELEALPDVADKGVRGDPEGDGDPEGGPDPGTGPSAGS
jgi:hypothetical protein